MLTDYNMSDITNACFNKMTIDIESTAPREVPTKVGHNIPAVDACWFLLGAGNELMLSR